MYGHFGRYAGIGTGIYAGIRGNLAGRLVLNATGDLRLARSVGMRMALGLYLVILGVVGTVFFGLFAVVSADANDIPAGCEGCVSGTGSITGILSIMVVLSLAALTGGLVLKASAKARAARAIEEVDTPPAIPENHYN